MAARLKKEAFAPVDAAWLHMDRLTNKMMITGVMMFDKPLDFARVKEVVNTRMLRHDRFRQRVREMPLGMTLPRWEEDPHFDLNAHIHRIALPNPGDMAALQELVSDLMSTSLDYSRPLWDFHVVENFGEGGAIVGRLHHCIGDGLALVDVLLKMTDPAPQLERTAPPKQRARDRLGQAIVPPVKWGVSGVQKLASNLLQDSWDALTHPAEGLELVRQGQQLTGKLAKQGVDVVAAAGKLLLTLPDRKTVFRGRCGRTKRAAWSEPFPLDEVKAIGKLLGGTVNDVLLAAVSGALRRYMEETDGKVVEINAMVPVNLRQPHEMGKLGNRFGLIILTLPVSTVDPVERILVMRKRMNDIKNSPEAVVAFVILSTLGLVPMGAEHLLVDFFAAKTSAVMTNVPGPREPLYLAGSRLNDLMFWVPVSSNTGMGISIMSYAGRVMVGIMTDACLVSDPITIAEYFNAELRDMKNWLASESDARPGETAISEDAEPASVETTDGAGPRKAGLTGSVENKQAEEIKLLKEAASPLPEPSHNGDLPRPRKRRTPKVVAEAPEVAPEEAV